MTADRARQKILTIAVKARIVFSFEHRLFVDRIRCLELFFGRSCRADRRRVMWTCEHFRLRAVTSEVVHHPQRTIIAVKRSRTGGRRTVEATPSRVCNVWDAGGYKRRSTTPSSSRPVPSNAVMLRGRGTPTSRPSRRPHADTGLQAVGDDLPTTTGESALPPCCCVCDGALICFSVVAVVYFQLACH